MRKITFTNEHFYHVFNRGVDKRLIFLDQRDYTRFYNSLFLFNDKNYRHPGGEHDFENEIEPRISELGDSYNYEPLTKIISFCLLPNHFHMMLQQVADKGISTFVYRLSKGYSRYFNLRHGRSGRLFESTFKANFVDRDPYFLHLPRYIHLNALDRHFHHWRDGTIQDWGEIMKALDDYRWSSHNVYSYRLQQLPVVDINSVNNLFPTTQSYLSFLREWAGRESIPSYLRNEEN